MLDVGGVAADRVAPAAPSAWCMYKGSLYNSTTTVEMKSLTLNLAMPMDHRVSGYVTNGKNDPSVFSKSYDDAFFGKPVAYMDAPGEYFEKHQYSSSPAADERYFLGNGADSAPLTRLLPPGSESSAAKAAARRRLAMRKHPRRKSSWKLVGIRPEWFAGAWVSRIDVVGGNSADQSYKVDAPIMSVVWDFVNNQTVLGGLLSEVSGA